MRSWIPAAASWDRERFERLAIELPPGQTILGIDENTALMMDLQAGSGKVLGAGEVVWLHVGHGHPGDEKADYLAASGLDEIIRKRGGHVHRYRTGESFPLAECCPLRMPVAGQGVPPEVWEQALEAAGRERERMLHRRRCWTWWSSGRRRG